MASLRVRLRPLLLHGLVDFPVGWFVSGSRLYLAPLDGKVLFHLETLDCSLLRLVWRC